MVAVRFATWLIRQVAPVVILLGIAVTFAAVVEPTRRGGEDDADHAEPRE